MKKSSFHTLSNGYACLLGSSKHIKIKIVMNANFAGDIVALQKPYGLAMFGAELQHSVEKYSQSLANFLGCETLHQVHRLDKITSGILLLAKTKECHLFLVEKFRQRQITFKNKIIQFVYKCVLKMCRIGFCVTLEFTPLFV